MSHGYLDGKVAIVTGGNRGIGRAIAIAAGEAGAKVVIVGRNAERNQVVVEEMRVRGLEALGISADIRSPEDFGAAVRQTVDTYGRIDILVNSGGESGVTAPVTELTLEDWRNTLDSNLTGAFVAARAVVPHMVEAGGGRIIFIGAIAAKAGAAHRTAYSSAKAGLQGLTRSLALELGRHRITVNCLVPGAVEGERIQQVVEEQSRQKGITVDQVRRLMTAGAALKSFTDPDDIAAAAVLLAGKSGSSITGVDINLNAGAYFG